jgi:hypothetical protein
MHNGASEQPTASAQVKMQIFMHASVSLPFTNDFIEVKLICLWHIGMKRENGARYNLFEIIRCSIEARLIRKY